jgi:HPr kinase/phosphorylase
VTGAGVLHATSVAVDGKGILILGPSGAGKSSLALQLIAQGAVLIADDRTEVYAIAGLPHLRCPQGIKGVIEVRQVGLLYAPTVAEAPLHLVVDLEQTEMQRLPKRHATVILGAQIDLAFGTGQAHFAIALMLQLRHGRHA